MRTLRYAAEKQEEEKTKRSHQWRGKHELSPVLEHWFKDVIEHDSNLTLKSHFRNFISQLAFQNEMSCASYLPKLKDFYPRQENLTRPYLFPYSAMKSRDNNWSKNSRFFIWYIFLLRLTCIQMYILYVSWIFKNLEPLFMFTLMHHLSLMKHWNKCHVACLIFPKPKPSICLPCFIHFWVVFSNVSTTTQNTIRK